MPTFLIRPGISQSSSYPVVLMMLGRYRSKINPHLIAEVLGIEPASLWLEGRYADHFSNKAVIF